MYVEHTLTKYTWELIFHGNFMAIIKIMKFPSSNKQTFLGSLRAFEMVKKRSRITVIYAKSDWHFNLYRLPFLSYSPCIPPKWPKADLS